MKIVNNFDLIKEKLHFNNPDEFYFIQILFRGKDGHTETGVNGNNKNRLIKYYTIKSLNHLESVKNDIISICDTLNARAYIHLTKRSFKEVSKVCLQHTVDTFLSENYEGLKGSFSTACGKSFITKDKKYIVDLDGDDVNKIDEYINFIETCEPLDRKKVLYTVPTLHGIHIITIPFNVAKFNSVYPNIDIHKNNPTLLYYKGLE